MNNKKYKPPKCSPYTVHFKTIQLLMVEVSVQATAKRQFSVRWSDTADAWEMTILGVEL